MEDTVAHVPFLESPSGDSQGSDFMPYRTLEANSGAGVAAGHGAQTPHVP